MTFHLIRRPPPRLDKTLTGVTFIDVLFALAAGKALDSLAQFSRIDWAGRAHFIVATVLIATSWLGYHESANKPKWAIHFITLPLFTFAIDVTLVGLYWLMALYVDGTNIDLANADSAEPEAWIVLGVFALYVAWDCIGRWMKAHGSAYQTAYYQSERKWMVDNAPRRAVTVVCLVLAGLVLAGVKAFNPQDVYDIVVVDGLLVLLLLLFRILKEAVGTPADADSKALSACRTCGQLPEATEPTPPAVTPPTPPAA